METDKFSAENRIKDIQQNRDTISVTAKADSQIIAEYITRVYGWMFIGLVLTAAIAYFVAGSPAIIGFLLSHTFLFYGLLIGELLMVGYLVVRIEKMTSQTATMIFLAYSAINGITLSLILLAYTGTSIASTFAITAGTFGIMSAVGYYTKQDLTSFGHIMFMGLIGVIIASIVNIFLNSSTLYWIITYVGVAVFVGLIAYDTQKIKSYAMIEDDEMREKGAIMGALALYLDFVNLFIMLLRIFGRRR